MKQQRSSLPLGLSLATAVALIACSGEKHGDAPEKAKQQPLDTPAFQAMLNDREGSALIEKVVVELGTCDDAQYIVTLKNTAVRRVVRAPFPGTLVSEIYHSNVPYAVKRDRPRAAGQREVDATTFRGWLSDPSEVASIESIRAEPFGQCAAMYVVNLKTQGGTRMVHAEFPGSIVAAIQAAQIPYSVVTR